MLTASVRNKLAFDYGIRDIPAELLEYFVFKYRSKFDERTLAKESAIAFCIANDWQRGKTVTAI